MGATTPKGSSFSLRPARPFPSVSLALIRFSGKLTKNSARCLHEGLLPLGVCVWFIKGKQRRENPLLPFFSPLGLNAEAVGGISHHISCSQRHIHTTLGDATAAKNGVCYTSWLLAGRLPAFYSGAAKSFSLTPCSFTCCSSSSFRCKG